MHDLFKKVGNSISNAQISFISSVLWPTLALPVLLYAWPCPSVCWVGHLSVHPSVNKTSDARDVGHSTKNKMAATAV